MYDMPGFALQRKPAFHQGSFDYAVAPVAVGLGVPAVPACASSSFCTGHAYFTGLSPETTLSVTYRTFVEYSPPATSDFYTEVTPCAEYDPHVFEVYNMVAKQAPYAVPVGQNAAGDFFRKVLGAVKTVAPIASKLLTPFPIASRVVGTIGAGAQALSRDDATMIPVVSRPPVVDSRPQPAIKTIMSGVRRPQQKKKKKSRGRKLQYRPRY